MSQKSGVPAKTLYHWLSGQQPRKMEHLFNVCDILDVSVEELFGRNRKASSEIPLPQSSALHHELKAGLYEIILRPTQNSWSGDKESP